MAGILLFSRVPATSLPTLEKHTAMSPNFIGQRMNSLDTSAILNQNIPASAVSEQQQEAARYALLRRLSPSLRHHMVRHLQPIGLICGVMTHRLARGEPDLQALSVNVEKINEFAKAALAQYIDTSTWLAPEPGVPVALDAGVMECVGLLATTLHFRGFRVINEVENLSCPVRQGALRMVLSAALLALTDGLEEPASLTLSASVDSETVTLLLQVLPREEGCVEFYDDGYRKLAWSDVQALACAEAVVLSRQDGQLSMRFTIESEASAV